MKSSLDAVLLIAMKTGWSPKTIRELSRAEFDHYLTRVIEANNA